MQSVVSYPDRGNYGKSAYRGNCSGRLIEDIIDQYHITSLSDFMVGSGTTEDVVRQRGLEGFFTENVRRGPGRTLELSYSRFLTRHRVCVFSQNAAFVFTQHPLLAHRQRCNLRVRLPARGSFRVRGLPDYLARELPLII